MTNVKLNNYFKKTKNKCLLIVGKTDFISELYKDYTVAEYRKKYKFRLKNNRITSENIDNYHFVIKNY